MLLLLLIPTIPFCVGIIIYIWGRHHKEHEIEFCGSALIYGFGILFIIFSLYMLCDIEPLITLNI